MTVGAIPEGVAPTVASRPGRYGLRAEVTR